MHSEAVANVTGAVQHYIGDIQPKDVDMVRHMLDERRANNQIVWLHIIQGVATYLQHRLYG